METAVLGAYEEDPYDQHNHLQTSFNEGLGESISFGRFAMDSFSWVKRSSFNHNQYLEELGNCSAPGSVREKKAYFEAYYKAKKEALEKALADENTKTDNNGMEDSGAEQGELYVDVASAEGKGGSSFLNAEDVRILKDTTDETNVTEAENLNLKHSLGPALDDNEHSTHDLSSNEVCQVPTVEDMDGQETVFSGEENFEKLENESNELIVQSGTESSEAVNIIEELIRPCEPTPQGHYVDDDNDGQDGKIVDVQDKEISDVPDMKKSHTPSKVSKAYVEKPSHSQTSKPKVTLKNTGNGVFNATSKLNKSNVERKLGPVGSITEVKNLGGTTNSHIQSTVTVPQPFELATNKRTAIISRPADEDGTKSSLKSIQNTAPPTHPLSLKRTRDPAMKNSMLKNPTAQASRQKAKAELPTVTLTNQMMQGVINTNEVKKDEKKRNGTVTIAQTYAKSRSSSVKNCTNAFSFKSDERAEKRREFNTRREAKLNAKEAEKNNAVAKTQEQEEAEVKQLRKSLKFRATPMPSFYQETTESKLETRKPGITATRAKSPKLGRKNVLNSSFETNSSTSSSKQDKGANITAYNCTRKESDMLLLQPSRNGSALPKKTAKTLVVHSGVSGTELSERKPGDRHPGAETKDHNSVECNENNTTEPVCTSNEVKNDDSVKLDLIHEKSSSEPMNGSITLAEEEIRDESGLLMTSEEAKVGSENGSLTSTEAESGVVSKTDKKSKEDNKVRTEKVPNQDRIGAGASPARRPPSPSLERKWVGASPAKRPPSPGLGLDRKWVGASPGRAAPSPSRDRVRVGAAAPSPSLDEMRSGASAAPMTPSQSFDPKRIVPSPSRTAPSPSRDRMWVGSSPARRAPSPSLDPKQMRALSAPRRAL